MTPTAILVLASVIAAPPPSEFPPERMFETVELASGVWAFISPETSGPIPSGNVLAVAGEESVLVVDSGRFPTLARRMVAEIRKRTNKPVRWLVHTHWHLDHIVGDAEFQAAFPGTTFVATAFTRRKMAEKQVPYVRDLQKIDAAYLEQLEPYVAAGKRRDGSPMSEPLERYLAGQVSDIRLEMADLAGARVLVPGLAFEDALEIDLGKRTVRVLFLGKGNTAGDAVVVVPDAKVVATGDLLVAPVPYGYGCHPGAWIATLRALSAIEAAAIVPGHGSVMRDWSYAAKVSPLLESVRAQAAKAAGEGSTLEETRKLVDLSAFRRDFAGDDFGRGMAFDDFFARSAVERAWQEARGEMAEE